MMSVPHLLHLCFRSHPRHLLANERATRFLFGSVNLIALRFVCIDSFGRLPYQILWGCSGMETFVICHRWNYVETLLHAVAH